MRIKGLTVLMLVGVIVVLSLAPDSSTPKGPTRGDWSVGHALAYGVLTLAVAGLGRRRYGLGRAAAAGALAASALGILMEWMQPAFGRTQSIQDVAMNQLGVIGALLVLSLHGRRRNSD